MMASTQRTMTMVERLIVLKPVPFVGIRSKEERRSVGPSIPTVGTFIAHALGPTILV